MAYIVTAVWIVQAVLGAGLVARWARRTSRRGGGRIAAHLVCALLGLVLWVFFAATSDILWSWLALAVLTVGNVVGDSMLTRRSRQQRGAVGHPTAGDYGAAVADTIRGRMPALVTTHALFSGVVYFLCLGVCVGATAAAAAPRESQAVSGWGNATRLRTVQVGSCQPKSQYQTHQPRL